VALAGLSVFAQTDEDAVVRNRIIAAYSSDFQNIDAEINKLRDAGYGWGEVIMALELAQLSGKTVEEIMAMREDDKGWAEIAMELGIHPSELGRAVAHVMSDGRSDTGGRPADTPAGPPQGVPGGPPEGVPGRP
jgi:hypothetical protein